MKKTWFAAFSALVLYGCGGISDSAVCPAWVPPSLIVTVRDSVSGANITNHSTLVPRNASGVVDSVTVLASSADGTIASTSLGGGATGTFSLAVRRSGCQAWTKDGIEVKSGQCGTQPVNLVAHLRPAA